MDSNMDGKTLTHVAGTFLIQADAAFLNGAGLGEGEDRNVAVPKTFWDGGNRVPYVSSQAWKRWLRNTLIEETGWPASELRAIGWNPRGNVNKIAAQLNPVELAEDDIFGYMRAAAGQGRTAAEEEEVEPEEDQDIGEAEGTGLGRTKSVMRASPFMASILVSLRSKGWEGQDEGFVHLRKYDPRALAEAEIERFLGKDDKKKSIWDRLKKEFGDDFAKEVRSALDKGNLDEGNLDKVRELLSAKAGEQGKVVTFIENPTSPLPYSTRFYNADLQAVFCLDYSRLGVYWNLGDRVELEQDKVKGLLKEDKIENITGSDRYKVLTDNGKTGRVYRITAKVSPSPKERAAALFRALAVLRGGAKQAQFGTDVAPKVLILAGLTCGNPIFNHLFEDGPDGPVFMVETFKEILKDYASRIVTPVLVGIRSGYLKNEADVKALQGTLEGTGVEVQVATPVEVAHRIGEHLP